jgi:hypothetical protein
MQPGSVRQFDNKDVTLDQIKTIQHSYEAGKLNQREEMLNEFTGKR